MIAAAIILAALLGLRLRQKAGLFQQPPATSWSRCPHCGCYWKFYPGPTGGSLVLIPGHVPDVAAGAKSRKCPNCAKEERDHAC